MAVDPELLIPIADSIATMVAERRARTAETNLRSLCSFFALIVVLVAGYFATQQDWAAAVLTTVFVPMFIFLPSIYAKSSKFSVDGVFKCGVLLLWAATLVVYCFSARLNSDGRFVYSESAEALTVFDKRTGTVYRYQNNVWLKNNPVQMAK